MKKNLRQKVRKLKQQQIAVFSKVYFLSAVFNKRLQDNLTIHCKYTNKTLNLPFFSSLIKILHKNIANVTTNYLQKQTLYVKAQKCSPAKNI